MGNFLGDSISVPFKSLYLDPNNPRLGLDDSPGYSDPDALFDDDLQPTVEQRLRHKYGNNIKGLRDAIKAQGWLPVDSVVVWAHPDVDDKYVVVEGNTRLLVLREVRDKLLPRQKRQLAEMKQDSDTISQEEIQNKQSKVDRLSQVIDDTKKLKVKPIKAESVEQLEDRLPRILSVRHITGVRQWTNYSEDLWLLRRYKHLYDEKYDDGGLSLEMPIVREVADEASLTTRTAKRKIRAVKAFKRFKREYRDRLPEEEEFSDQDYFLFENVSKKRWVREQLGFGTDKMHVPNFGMEALFEWTFKYPRGNTADDNPNVFYRHQNIKKWESMKKYDDKYGTAFAAHFDPDQPGEAPPFRKVEAQWEAHKAKEEANVVIENLLNQLKDLEASHLANEGEFFKKRLEEIRRLSDEYIRMVEALEADDGAPVEEKSDGAAA